MTGENLQKTIRDELLENECVFKLMVLKLGDRLRDDYEFKDCYDCIGQNENCAAYIPYKPKPSPSTDH